MNPSAVTWAITPLRMIFWGGLLCIFDFTITQTTNGRGFKFDILNDALGAVLIAIGVFRLGAIPVSARYASVMTFVRVVSVLAVVNAIRGHFVAPVPEWFSLVLEVFGLVTFAAIIAFCVAMRWFSEEAGLAEAARSWAVTTLLFAVIYLVPLGLLGLAAHLGIVGRVHIDGPAVLLLLVVFAIPLVHLFVSTSRMRRGAEAAAAAGLGEFPAGGAEPPTVSTRTILAAVALAVVAVAGVVLLVVLPVLRQGPAAWSEVKVGPSGTVNIEDALAVEDTGRVESGYFVGAQYGVANDEYAFLVLPALRRGDAPGGGSGSSSTGELSGHWQTRGGAAIAFRCTVRTAETAAGTMEIAGSRWGLADGRVFLVKPRPGGAPEVRQVAAPLEGARPEAVIKNLVRDSAAVRGFLVAELTEGLRSDDPARRTDAALFLYRCGLAGELPTPLLVELLKADEGWVRLMAAKALWDRQRHEAAIPTLAGVVGQTGPSASRVQAARVLGGIGPDAKAAAPALREAVKSQDRELAAVAGDALKRVEQ